MAPFGNLLYIGNPDYHGLDSLGYVATDGLFETSGEVTILIRPINDEPIAGDDFFGTLEGTELTGNLGGNDLDPDGDPLHCEPFTPPSHGEAIVDTDCTFSYIPAPGFVGADQLSYRAIDTGSAIATVFIEVVDRGDSAPVFTSEPPLSVVQGGTYEYDADASDGDIGDVLTYSLIRAPLGTTIDPVTGLIHWIPSRLQVGEGVKFIVAVTDLTLQTVEQTFEVSVVSTIDPPAIVSTAPVYAIAGQGFVYPLDAIDLDPGDVLEYSLAAGPAGASIDPADGLFTWVPTLEQLGAQTVTVRVTDSAGLTDEQTFVVTVLDSYPPVADFVVADGESRSFGSTIVSADGSGAANVLLPIEPNQSVYWNATFATGRSIVFELPGDGTALIDRVVLRGDGTNFSAKTFELRITTTLPALASSAPVLTGVLPKDGQAHELAFDATRGGFAKLTVLDNYGGSAVRLRNFDLRGAPRFGGLVSMLEGGASVERVTAGTVTQAGRAISYEEKGLSWSAPAGTSLFVNLTQDLHVIDRIRLESTTNTSALKELELRVSASGSADSDFTTALVATLPQDGLMHAFTFPPVSARFVQLISRSSYGSTTVTIANFQVFARDVGGRTLSLEDRSKDLDGQIVTYRWDFGDGTGSSEPNPTHRYANSGTYRVTLEVTMIPTCRRAKP